jgi:diadenosine tetraphosphatase ApaH/serine/threonine PP2A family protein phosphatase
MRIALLSDIHANRHAFDACLAHAEGQAVDRFVLLGDLVGYGGDPVVVVERAMALAERGAILVQGNHDAMAVSPPVQPHTLGHMSAPWTHAQLRADQRDFLAALPLTQRLDQALLVHASADEPARWHYVLDPVAAVRSMMAASEAAPGVRYVFSGHVHDQALYFVTQTAKFMRFNPQPGVPVPVPAHRQWLALVGSVGQPRDGDPRAGYAVFDTEAARLTFHRVPYDIAGAAAAIRAAGLPEFYAERLEIGQ